MKDIFKNIKVLRIVLMALFILLVVYMIYAVQTYGSRWFSTPYNTRIEKQKSNVIAGKIYDRNNNILAANDSEGEREYSDDRKTRMAVSHIVGDTSGLTANGAESMFSKYLLGFDQNIIDSVIQGISGERQRGSDIVLTIDGELSKIAYEAMGSYNGAVVLINYKTGEVLASVSKPGYNPESMADYKPDDDGKTSGDKTALVNRVTMGRYTPGSVFKLVPALAMIQSAGYSESKQWSCDGPLVFDSESEKYLPNVHFSEDEDLQWRKQQEEMRKSGGQGSEDEEIPPEDLDSGAKIGDYKLLRDYQSSYHDTVSLKQAFAVSCNHTFAQIALDVGDKKMTKAANKLGFNEDFLFKDIVVYGSKYISGETDYRSGWASIGQHTDIATPIHMALISASIANNGSMMEPKLLRAIKNTRGITTNVLSPKEYMTTMSPQEAAIFKEYMRFTVTDGTASRAGVSGYEVAGKTGTAEVSNNKDIGNHAWFTGFVNSGDHPLAIAVILEHAGSGGGKAAPVAGEVLKAAIRRGY